MRAWLILFGLLGAGMLRGQESRAGEDWWSLQPLREVSPPGAGVDRGPAIDAFVAERLEDAGLTISPPASPRVQVRRLYFDLIGMPPSPEVVKRFEDDPSDAAYEALVDELLSSPHFGERWGRHWLDVARFGESDGFERNNPRENLWPYRDWVIRALNEDLPYDEFARMQIAGDVLRPGLEGNSAAAFLAAGLHNTVVGGSEFMKKTARQDELEEITGAVGQAFLGLTVNCGRCHEHKYDPVSQEEYYQMTAALAGVYHGEREVQDSESLARAKVLREEVDRLDAALAAIDGEARDVVLARRRANPAAEMPDPPQPMARWEFDGDLKDSVGTLHGKAEGGARLENGALVLDGVSAFVRTVPLERDLDEKTLEAWVLLESLDQRGGAPISVQTRDGATFDAIVFGERTPRAWMAGSNVFARSQVHGGPPEQDALQDPVHVAVVYARDGTITRYRNGQPYDQAYQTGLQEFRKGNAEVLFGLRHGTAGGGRLLSGRILRAQLYDRALSPDAVAASAGVESDYVAEEELLAVLEPARREERGLLKSRAVALQEELKQHGSAGKRKVYTVAARGNPGVTHFLERGHALQPRDAVVPGAIAAVTGPSADFGLPADAPDGDRRQKLAEWITHRENALFARVIVNRIWHHHFGSGLVTTPSDLGFNGGLPSHPALLEWMAAQLKAHGYRLKPLHRMIVTSSAYRQSSRPREDGLAVDADNRLLWRRAPTRLDAESLRDAMLEVSGKLNRRMGGPGFRDVTVRYLDGTNYYTPFDKEDPELNRRAIYRFSPRGQRSAVLETFDCPDPSAAAPRRSVTTTPLQALALLNNAFVLRMADGLAERAREEAGVGLSDQVARIYELAYGRSPDREELDLGVSLAREHGLAALARVVFNSNEFVVIE